MAMLPSKKIVPEIVSVPGLPGVQARRPSRFPCASLTWQSYASAGVRLTALGRLRFIVPSVSNAGGVPVCVVQACLGPGFEFKYQ